MLNLARERLSWRRGITLAAVCLMAARSDADVRAPRRLVVMCEERVLTSWQTLERIAREFERENPGLTVELVDEAGASGSRDKIKFLLAGGLQLDVARVDVTEIAAYSGEGALIDLEPYAAADADFRPGDWFEAPLAALRDARGHLFGLPSTFTPYVMYVNLDLLAAAGLARPAEDWTWDDLLRACRAATRDADGDGVNEQYGISLTQWLQAVVPWIWQNGGDLLDARGERSRLAEPAAVEALAFVRALLHEERVASFDASFANQFSQGLFQAGRAAFYGPVGYWETYRFKDLRGFRWDVVPLPRRAAAATSVAMTCYVVPRTAREPELAWRFVRLLAGPEYQRVLAEIGNGVPGLRAVAESKSFLKPDVAPESERVFLDVLPTARFLPPLSNWRKIESLCQAELEGCLLLPEFDVAAACARMAEKTDRFLALERERRTQPVLPRGTLEIGAALSILAVAALVLARRGRVRARLERREERAAWTMLLPWAIGFAAFLVAPAGVSLLLSVCEWSPLRPLADARFVGTANLARAAHDPTLWTSLGATCTFALLYVPLGLVLSFALALLVSGTSALHGVARTLIYLPVIVSPVILGALGRRLLDAEDGWLASALSAFGIAGPAWLRDPDWVVPGFVIIALWGIGAQMLVFVAALQALDPAQEEAARLDGAGRWSRLVHVVLPQLSPVILFNAVTGIAAAFQIFAQAYVMTGGGPGDASRFLVLYLYETAFRHLDMGYASVIAWTLVIVLGLVLLGVFALARPFVHYAGRPRS